MKRLRKKSIHFLEKCSKPLLVPSTLSLHRSSSISNLHQPKTPEGVQKEGMHPPVEDELKDNPIHLWTPADKLVLYANETYDFKIYARALPGSELQPIDTTEHLFGQQTERLNAAAEEIRKIEDRQAYDEHTDLVHDYFRNPTILQ
uniref:Cytochrome b-c1 complex subunit 7 n=1 Tax=Caenorhabditis tropicalis TaxID=1561998 RepID=A0A1I7UP43_9PELO